MVQVRLIEFRQIPRDQDYDDPSTAYVIETEHNSYLVRVEYYETIERLLDPNYVLFILQGINKDEIMPLYEDVLGEVEYEGGFYLNGTYIKLKEI